MCPKTFFSTFSEALSSAESIFKGKAFPVVLLKDKSCSVPMENWFSSLELLSNYKECKKEKVLYEKMHGNKIQCTIPYMYVLSNDPNCSIELIKTLCNDL